VNKNLSVPAFFITSICILALTVSHSFAASLALTRIGALDLNGSSYTEWWYTGTNPTLYGTAVENAPVEIIVNSVSTEITADASGNWSHAPSQLTTGEHNVSISSNGETISFLLHVGESVPASVGEEQIAEPETADTIETTKGGQTSEVPVTGLFDNQIYAYAAIALGLIIGGTVISQRFS